jgi:hypothetical protein
MKHLELLLLGLLFILILPQNLFSQAPDGVNYQAVVRGPLGLPLNVQPVSVRFTIHQGSPTGAAVFQEVHATSTNQFGLINLELGSVDNANFSIINWGNGGAYYLQIEVDPGTGFDDLGASQLLSVPYALFAKSAATGAQGFNSLIDTVTATSAACPTGGYQVLIGLDANANTVLDPGEVSSSFVVCNGTTGLANLNDTSATNEIQTLSINTTNDTIFLSNGGGFVVLPSLGDNDWIIAGNDMSSGISGNVGIGVLLPTKKLSIRSLAPGGDGIEINNASATGNPGLEFQTQGTPRYVLGVDQTDNNKFKIGTTNVNINTRFTIDNQGLVGIGNTNPVHQLTVFSADTVIASFTGSDPDASVISVLGTNPNAFVGSVFLTGSDSGIVGIDPSKKIFYMSNTTVGGHTIISGDSSSSMYGINTGSVATNLIFNKSPSIYNEADTIFSYSTSGPNLNYNQGTFKTDSLYVLGGNLTPGYVLANGGNGKAVWADPSSLLGGGGLWQSNAPDIFFNTGKVGIGIAAPVSSFNIIYSGTDAEASLVNFTNTSAAGVSAGYHVNANNTGTGPIISGSFQVNLSGNASETHAVRAVNIANGNNNYGIEAEATGTGTANYGGRFSTNGGSVLNSAISANASASGTAQATGIRATAFGTTTGTTYGVYGQNSSASSGVAYAGYFQNLNNTGSLVYGVRSEVNSSSANNQYGLATSMSTVSTGIKYGVYSIVTGGTTNWAGYFAAGDVYIAENLVIPTGAALGNVLTSDAAGVATWQAPPAGLSPWTQGTGGVYPSIITDAVWIGTSNPIPGASLHIAKEGGVNVAVMETFGGSDSKFVLSQANGTMTIPAKTISGNTLGVIEFDGHQGGIPSNYARGADILVTSESDFSLSNATSFHIRTMNNASNYDTRIAIDADGEVGIGTTTPGAKLDIIGKVKITDGTEAAGNVLVSDAAGVASWKPNAVAFETSVSNSYTVPNGPFPGNSPVNFDGVIFNDGGAFDPTSGAYNFRPNISGVYAIEATILLDYSGVGPNEQVRMAFVKNSTLPVIKTAQILINSGEIKTITISTTMRLNANDAIHVEVGSFSGSTILINPSEAVWFSGHLVYAD